MSKTTPAKAGDAEPKPQAVVANASAATAETATTGATTETTSLTGETTSPNAQIDPKKMVKARVLTDCVFGKANSVVEVDSVTAYANPALDPNEAAVAYAELIPLITAGRP